MAALRRSFQQAVALVEAGLRGAPALEAAQRQFPVAYGQFDGTAFVAVVGAVGEATLLGEFGDVGKGLVDALATHHEVEQANPRDVE